MGMRGLQPIRSRQINRKKPPFQARGLAWRWRNVEASSKTLGIRFKPFTQRHIRRKGPFIWRLTFLGATSLSIPSILWSTMTLRHVGGLTVGFGLGHRRWDDQPRGDHADHCRIWKTMWAWKMRGYLYPAWIQRNEMDEGFVSLNSLFLDRKSVV